MTRWKMTQSQTQTLVRTAGPDFRQVLEASKRDPLWPHYQAFRQAALAQAGPNANTVIPQFRQFLFQVSPADITIYGGAAGGGKTYALLMDPLRHRDNGLFGSVIFRNTFPQIDSEGGLWDTSELLYPYVQGQPNRSRYWWTFPSGMRVRFGYLNRDSDKFYYQGAQIAMIAYDQLEQIGESSFFFMLSRNRSMSGIPGYIKATCNPDADSWLAQFLAWWIADDGYAHSDRSGKIRFFIRYREALVWSSRPEKLLAIDPQAEPKSVTFITSTVYDNQILLQKDPSYVANLKALLPVDRERLLGHPTRGGNWKIKAGAGDIFNRDWFELVTPEQVPQNGDACLFWDFASTEKQTQGDDPDYTAAVLMLKADDRYWWLQTISFREGPGETMRRFRNRSRQIAAEQKRLGRRFYLRWEIEPGSAAKRENEQLMAEFPELDAEGIRSTGDKLVRARPLAQSAFIRMVYMVFGDWTEETLIHLHNQPHLKHDDIMDAGGGAYNVLVGDLMPLPAGVQTDLDVDDIIRNREENPDQLFPERGRNRIWGRGNGRRGRRPRP